jgi:hypothetical protein
MSVQESITRCMPCYAFDASEFSEKPCSLRIVKRVRQCPVFCGECCTGAKGVCKVM